MSGVSPACGEHNFLDCIDAKQIARRRTFLIAFVLEVALLRKDVPLNLQLALTTGFMGGFTTYSSFNYETTRLVLDGHPARGVANICATLVGAIAAGLFGLWLARRIAP